MTVDMRSLFLLTHVAAYAIHPGTRPGLVSGGVFSLEKMPQGLARGGFMASSSRAVVRRGGLRRLGRRWELARPLCSLFMAFLGRRAAGCDARLIAADPWDGARMMQ